MKILVVEDDSFKLKKIVKIINKSTYRENIKIDFSLDIKCAKKLLEKMDFDLLLLDINIPSSVGEENLENGGVILLVEIMSIDKYKKPKNIVFLTEYGDLYEKYKVDISNFPFYQLTYDSSNARWEDQLLQLVNNMAYTNANSNYVQVDFDFDVALITAIDIESRELKKLIKKWNQKQIDKDPTIYYETTLKSIYKNLKIVHAQQYEMGETAASTLTLKMIHHFKPRYVIMIGIAAGIGDKKNYGDILFATEVWTYNTGKYISKPDEAIRKFSPDPKHIQVSPVFRELVGKDFSDTLKQIKEKSIIPIEGDLSIYKGPIACGSAVIADLQMIEDYITNHSRKTIGLDMESYGVFYSAQNSFGPNPQFMCVKSICDFANSRKDDKYQNLAAYTSTAFVIHLISCELDYI